MLKGNTLPGPGRDAGGITLQDLGNPGGNTLQGPRECNPSRPGGPPPSGRRDRGSLPPSCPAPDPPRRFSPIKRVAPVRNSTRSPGLGLPLPGFLLPLPGLLLSATRASAPYSRCLVSILYILYYTAQYTRIAQILDRVPTGPPKKRE